VIRGEEAGRNEFETGTEWSNGTYGENLLRQGVLTAGLATFSGKRGFSSKVVKWEISRRSKKKGYHALIRTKGKCLAMMPLKESSSKGAKKRGDGGERRASSKPKENPTKYRLGIKRTGALHRKERDCCEGISKVSYFISPGWGGQ